LKYLVILLLLLIFWAFVLWRLRPYIEMARRVLGIMKDVRQVTNQDLAEPARSAATGRDGQKLVRCASCQTWIPASRALKLRSQSSVYCSHECLERAADQPARARRSSGSA
jgi:hypothetical protein